jgi:putative DNA-invertase from lambdoid prophage Rac
VRPRRTVINAMTFDGATKDPMQQAVRDALIAFMPRPHKPKPKHPRKHNGLASPMRAKRKTKSISDGGHSYNRQQVRAVTIMLANGVSVSEIARSIKLSRQVIYRIKDAPAEVEALLAKWERRAT